MATATFETEEIELANKQAWDSLYGQTSELIWGSEPLAFVRTALEKITPYLPGKPLLLDAATGEGRNLPTLLEFTHRVVACDSSCHALEKLRRRFPDSVRTELCDLAETPFDTNRFDAILACDVIETLPNLSEVLREFCRILRPGGFLICNVPDLRDGIAGQDMEMLGGSEYLYQNRFFFRFQQKEDFIEFLDDNGMKMSANFSDTWTEAPHPEYRQEEHSHTSQIIIARKYEEQF